jgi:hypothetical protein
MRALFQQARPLEPADLNAAAPPAQHLTEPVEIGLLSDTTEALRRRVQALLNRLNEDRDDLESARTAFVAKAREARRRIDAQEEQDEIDQALDAAETARRTLSTALWAVSRYAEPEALSVVSTSESVAHPERADEFLSALAARLDARRGRLEEGLTATGGPTPNTLSQARGRVRLLTTLLQTVLDGEALPILPPTPRVPVTEPSLQAATSVAAALDGWPAVRAAVARAARVTHLATGYAAFPVAADATADDDPESDEAGRDEGEAPRVMHYGVFLCDGDKMLGAQRHTEWLGVVADEWVEQRPSRTQMAALALNYDSPQSEPPHCLLLCVPPGPAYAAWTELRAAGMVLETIRWMKIRGLSSDDKPTPGALFPSANQVAAMTEGQRGPNRLPTGRYSLAEWMDTVSKGIFTVVNDPAKYPTGVKAVGFNEIAGSHKIEE